MCRLRTNAGKQTDSDVRNIVLGVIMRQEQEFAKQDVCRISLLLLSPHTDREKHDVNQIASEYLDYLLRSDKISCEAGMFKPRTVKHYYDEMQCRNQAVQTV